MTITLDQQIAAARRELALRKNVYAKRIRERTMSLDQATREYCNALAILRTLEAIEEGTYENLEDGWHFDEQAVRDMLDRAILRVT